MDYWQLKSQTYFDGIGKFWGIWCCFEVLKLVETVSNFAYFLDTSFLLCEGDESSRDQIPVASKDSVAMLFMFDLTSRRTLKRYDCDHIISVKIKAKKQ